MKNFKGWPTFRWIVVVGLFALATVVASPWPVYASGEGSKIEGWKIKIKAQNRSTADTPFCGVGGGLVGDRLVANVFTDLSGVTTGTATFKPATGPAVTLNIDGVFIFFGGVVLRDSSTSNVVAIWLSANNAPLHVNVEFPQGCGNTKSTFTAGVDKLNLQIKVTDNDEDDD